MLRFARLHIQPDEEAEDAVQDALLAVCACDTQALHGCDPSLFVWHPEEQGHRPLAGKYRHTAVMADGPHDELDEELFDERGHWHSGVAPATWSSPETHLVSHQFLRWWTSV